MKKIMLGMVAIMMLVISGCGGGSVEVVIPLEPVVVHPPSITLNEFTKDVVREFVNGSVTFYAPDSDIDTMTVVVFDPRGYEISRAKTLINLPHTLQGTIPFSIDYATFPSEVNRYTFTIYLTDFNGNTSNQAVGTFYVP